MAKDTLASYVDRDCLLLPGSCSFESSVLVAQELELANGWYQFRGLVLTSRALPELSLATDYISVLVLHNDIPFV